MARTKKVDFAETKELDDLEHLKQHHKKFVMAPEFWDSYSIPYNPNKFKWVEEKLFIKNTSNKLILNPELESITKNIGGIYIFTIKSPILFHIANYLMYIGKVESSENYGIVNRMKNYYSGSYTGESRLNIKELFKHWADYIYVSYALIGKNNVIKPIEDALIDAIVPPVNIKMGSTKMQRIKNAW